MTEMPKPVACTIDLTEACPLRCDYCFTWSKHKPRAISDETAFRIIDWWLPQTNSNHGKPVEVSFWGGEPLLEFEKLKRIKHYTQRKADELGRDVIYGGTTNGVLYTPDKVEWCLKNKALFLVSVDGLKEQHDAHRVFADGSGSWDHVIANLKEAVKIASDTHVRMSLVPEYAWQFLDAIKFLHEEIGIKHLAFSPVMEADWTPAAMETLKEQFRLAVEYYCRRLKEGHSLALKHFWDEATIPAHRKNIQNPCGAGNGYMAWSVDGFCFPCHRFNKHDIPTEERAKLSTIIARPKGDSFEWCNHEWREQFVTFKDDPPKQCNGCEILGRSVCNGGCYAVNYDLTGSLKEVPLFECEFNKLQHATGEYMREYAKSIGLDLRMADPNRPRQVSGCICHNMCYHEGMEDEIIHINRSVENQCLCNQAQYSGEMKPRNTRGLGQILTHQSMRNRFVELSTRIFATADEPRSPEQRVAEVEVLKKTVALLKGDPSLLL